MNLVNFAAQFRDLGLMVASVAHFVSGASSTFYGVVLGTEVLARRSRCLARQQNAFFMLYVI